MARQFTGRELIIASHNQGKLKEISAMFKTVGKDIDLTSAADHDLPSPPETGTTFLENGTMKGLFVAKATGKIALADDSGICIDALNGAPGVYSADWAEEADKPRDFKRAMERVHREMGDHPSTASARFISLMALVWPDGHVETVEGSVEGNIVWPPRGRLGHGYDPIFVPVGNVLTFGEMSDDDKNLYSHRADAFKKMLDKCFR